VEVAAEVPVMVVEIHQIIGRGMVEMDILQV
jgi:hypothetical protein